MVLAAVALVALPCDGSLSGAALGMDGKVRARAPCGGGVCVEGVMQMVDPVSVDMDLQDWRRMEVLVARRRTCGHVVMLFRQRG
jgi:predicted phage tail protein